MSPSPELSASSFLLAVQTPWSGNINLLGKHQIREQSGDKMGCLLHQSPKFYNNAFLFVGLTTLGTFNWLIRYLEIYHVSTTILIYIRGNFLLHHWGCTSIYRLQKGQNELYFLFIDAVVHGVLKNFESIYVLLYKKNFTFSFKKKIV